MSLYLRNKLSYTRTQRDTNDIVGNHLWKDCTKLKIDILKQSKTSESFWSLYGQILSLWKVRSNVLLIGGRNFHLCAFSPNLCPSHWVTCNLTASNGLWSTKSAICPSIFSRKCSSASRIDQRSNISSEKKIFPARREVVLFGWEWKK